MVLWKKNISIVQRSSALSAFDMFFTRDSVSIIQWNQRSSASIKPTVTNTFVSSSGFPLFSEERRRRQELYEEKQEGMFHKSGLPLCM